MAFVAALLWWTDTWKSHMSKKMNVCDGLSAVLICSCTNLRLHLSPSMVQFGCLPYLCIYSLEKSFAHLTYFLGGICGVYEPARFPCRMQDVQLVMMRISWESLRSGRIGRGWKSALKLQSWNTTIGRNSSNWNMPSDLRVGYASRKILDSKLHPSRPWHFFLLQQSSSMKSGH